MEMNQINLFNIDVSNLRTERQKINNQLVFNLLKNRTPRKEIDNHINGKALDRILNEENITYDQFLDQCLVNDFITRSQSRNISINASRQGKVDEKLIIDGINSVVVNYGIKVKGVDVNSIRFCNDGRVLDGKSFNKENLDKNKDGMKSIDAIIEVDGRVQGYIFAKVVIGEGGHQDNVSIEAIKFIEWVKKFGQVDKIYVVLVDGEDITSLKNMEMDNLWIVDHVDFQKRLIDMTK